jgi:hypothetical protein
MYTGYPAGEAMLPANVGGKDLTAVQAHEILAPFVEPISAAILVLTIGVLLGGLGFLLTYRSSADAASIRTSDKIQDDIGPVR